MSAERPSPALDPVHPLHSILSGFTEPPDAGREGRVAPPVVNVDGTVNSLAVRKNMAQRHSPGSGQYYVPHLAEHQRNLDALVAALFGDSPLEAASTALGGFMAGTSVKIATRYGDDAVAAARGLFAGSDDVARSTPTAAREGTAATSAVAANRTAGNAFRDTVAGRLESELGVNIVGKEVTVRTPLGRRVIDILGERNGSLVNFETKLGESRYLPSQRAKDFYLSRVGIDVLGNGTRTRIPTVVIRGPLR